MEQDSNIRALVTTRIRTQAITDTFNPFAAVKPDTKGLQLQLVDLMVVRTRFDEGISWFFGDKLMGYRAHARYTLGGPAACLALEIHWVPQINGWSVDRQESYGDRCEPWW